MRKIITLLAAALFTLAAASIAYAAKPKNLVAGPWVTNVSETGFNVLWVSGMECMSYLEIAPEDGSAFNSMERPRHYQTVSGRSVITRIHNIRVDGLRKGQTYRYRMFLQPVTDCKPYSITYGGTLATTQKYWEDFSVTTADYGKKECRFSVVNDMHYLADKYSALLKGKTEKDMDFLLLNGDIVSYSQNIDTVAKYTFSPAQDLLGTVPVVYARGNHESRGKDFGQLPLLFPTPTGEFYHIFRQGPVAFIILDAGEDKPDSSTEYSGYAHFDDYRAAELEWLKGAINDPLVTSAPVRIAVLHIPSHKKDASWYTQRWITDNFNPILDKAGIDLMLSAHHHKYIWYEKDASHNFPILVNSNLDRLDVTADASGIVAKVFDLSGKEIHRHEIKK